MLLECCGRGLSLGSSSPGAPLGELSVESWVPPACSSIHLAVYPLQSSGAESGCGDLPGEPLLQGAHLRTSLLSFMMG